LALLDNLWLFAYDCLDPLQFFCHFSNWTNKVRISEDSICYDLGELISCAMSCYLKKIWVFLKMAFVWKFLFCLGIGQTFRFTFHFIGIVTKHFILDTCDLATICICWSWSLEQYLLFVHSVQKRNFNFSHPFLEVCDFLCFVWLLTNSLRIFGIFYDTQIWLHFIESPLCLYYHGISGATCSQE